MQSRLRQEEGPGQSLMPEREPRQREADPDQSRNNRGICWGCEPAQGWAISSEVFRQPGTTRVAVRWARGTRLGLLSTRTGSAAERTPGGEGALLAGLCLCGELPTRSRNPPGFVERSRWFPLRSDLAHPSRDRRRVTNSMRNRARRLFYPLKVAKNRKIQCADEP